MTVVLTIFACFWAFMFILTLALVTANRRVTLVDEPTSFEFQAGHHFVNEEADPAEAETVKDFDFDTDRGVVTSTDRRTKRLAGKRETIFVVDDDPDILNLIQHVLAVEGFEVRAFTNPEEALAEFNASRSRPRAVVTDFCMHPMNGLELIHRCRETDPALKTIVISGMVDETALAKSSEKTDGFLAKPFKVSNLVQTLNHTLEEARN